MKVLACIGGMAAVVTGTNVEGAARPETPALFAAAPGVRAFSGQMVLKAKRAPASDAAALGREKLARQRIEAWLVRHVDAVDEDIIRVPQGDTENSLAARLIATGDYEYVVPDWLVHAAVVPNDPLYAQQWHLPRVGAPSAWDISVGIPGAIVAVCDSGIDHAHPDLAAALLPGYNAVDRLEESAGGNTNGLTDHGTEVAGVAGAIGNNGVGVCGMGWNLRLYPVRVSNTANDTALLSDINEGARWAVDHGARVINASFSSVHNPSVSTTGAYVRQHGGLYVWAAGNAAGIVAPLDLPDLVVVAATDQQNAPAFFSNFGPAIDLCAPGVGIQTTRLSGLYATPNGTSFSAPIVSGALALLWSVNPSLTPAQAEAALLATATDLGTPGRDDRFGAGLLNVGAAAALARDALTMPVAPFARDDTAWLIGAAPLTLDVLANDADLNTGEALSVAQFTATTPAGGHITRTQGGDGRDRLVYAPRTGFHGVDSFAYAAGDPTGRTDGAAVRVGVARAATFAPAAHVTDLTVTGTQISGLAIADFDADGRPDVVLSRATTTGTLSIVHNNGNGQFAFGAGRSLSVAPDALSVGDLNGDLWPDVVVVNNLSNVLGVALGTGAYAFGPVTTYAASSPTDVIVTDNTGGALDLNHDGRTDIVHLSTTTAWGVVVRLNNGAGGFGASQTYPANIGSIIVRAGDLSGDGFADLVVGDTGTRTVSVFLNDGTGHFAAPVGRGVDLTPHDLAITDVDGDTDLDVISLGSGLLGEIAGARILLNDGHGALTLGGFVGTTGNVPVIVGTGDLNRDGVPDAATANLISGDLVVHLNLGTGEFVPTPVTLASGQLTLSRVLVTDLTGDGLPDIVAARSVIEGIGFLRPDVLVLVNNTPRPVCPADFNADGTVGSQDFFDFLTAFFTSAPAADFNADGVINSQDLFDFLGAFFTPC